MTGGVMVEGGLSYQALLHGSSTDSIRPDDLTYVEDGGLAFMPGAIVDTHFG